MAKAGPLGERESGPGVGLDRRDTGQNHLHRRRLDSECRPHAGQAQGFARAVNLSTSDIPEATLAARRSSTSDAQEKREFHACEDHGLHVEPILEASSPRLKRGRELETEQFSSAVSVIASTGAIAHEFVDMLAYAVGHGAVEVTAISVTQPVPATTEQELLLALLLARAKAHSI